MVFRDRQHSGKLLAERLMEFKAANPVVLALPRGGLPVGRAVADALGAPLGVVVARKIGAPGNEEFAIGAVTARGHRVLNEHALRHLMMPPGYLDRVTEAQRRVAEDREARYRGLGAPLDLRGRTVVLVDDGIATGMTMRAAIADVCAQAPAQVVVAAPVMPPDTYDEMRRLADRVVALEVPEDFYAVGQFYEDFTQVSDAEAEAILAAKTR